MKRRLDELPDMEWVEDFSKLLDSKFRVPFTNFRFGIDPLIGLIPVAGDVISLAMSGMLIRYVYKYGANPLIIIKMVGNSTLDFLISLIPFVGNIYDFFYKSNIKNLKILKDYYERQAQKGYRQITEDADYEVLT